MSTQADNILSTTGSIVSILTFLSAASLTLYLYIRAAAASPQEINEFIISLQFSFEEMQRFAHAYASYESTTTAPARPAEAQALAAKAYMIEGHTAVRLESLRRLALQVGSMAHDSAVRRWTHRVRYVLLQDEVQKQIAVKDRLMEDLRRVRERFDKYDEERRQQRQDEILQQQHGLLLSIVRRLDALDMALYGRGEAIDEDIKQTNRHSVAETVSSSETAVAGG